MQPLKHHNNITLKTFIGLIVGFSVNTVTVLEHSPIWNTVKTSLSLKQQMMG